MVYSSLAVIFVEESFKQVVKMRFPIGIQSFEKLIKAGYLYVDKTELIYKMVDTGNYYFLSRPNEEEKKISLSIKALLPDEDETEEVQEDVASEE